MDIASLITSKEATQKGREFAFGDATLVIAASGNNDHRKALRRLYEPHAKMMAFGGASSLAPETATAIDDEAMAEAVLVGWSGLKNDGKDFLYSRENALWLLKNVAVVRNFIVKASEDMALFTVGAVEAAKDVLKKSSDGN